MITHWSQILQNFTRTNDDQRHNEHIMRAIRYHRYLWEASKNQRNDHALISDITKFYKNKWWSKTQRNYHAWYQISQKSMGSNKQSKKWSCTDLRYYIFFTREMITHWSQILQNFTKTNYNQRHNETIMRDIRYDRNLWEAAKNQRNDHALIPDITKLYKNKWWPKTQRNLHAWYQISQNSLGSNHKSKKWSRTDLRYYKTLQEHMMTNDTTKP